MCIILCTACHGRKHETACDIVTYVVLSWETSMRDYRIISNVVQSKASVNTLI